MEIEIAALHSPEDFAALNSLYERVWGTPALTSFSPVFMHMITGSPIGIGLALGARLHGLLVGACFAIGTEEPGASYMVMLGVAPEVRSRSVGYALFVEARRIFLARNVARVYWTYDPLERSNATLYVHRLGVTSARYLPGFYGDRPIGPLAIPDDRLWVCWELAAPEVAQRIAGDLADGWPELPAWSAAAGAPARVCVEIPWDIKGLRAQDPPAVRRWRDQVARDLTTAFDHGYRVVDFRRGEGRCAYVLASSGATR